MSDIHDGHRERVRERFLSEGLDGFQDHNILEMLLFFGIPRRDTNEIAHNLINAFGSLSAVFETPYEDLCKVKGMTQISAMLIIMIPQLCRKYLDDKYKVGTVLDSPDKIGQFFLNKYVGRRDEMVSIICMDNKGKMTYWGIVSEGTVNMAEISVRKIVQIALRQNSSHIAIAHNHPNGVAIPSAQDIKTTAKIKSALSAVGVNLVDHIIVADDDFISLADSEYANFIATLG